MIKKLITFPKKIKVYALILTSVVALGSLFYMHYDGIKNTLKTAQRDVQELRQALDTAESSARRLEQENIRLDRILVQREQERKATAEQLSELQELREKEYETNKEYAECAPVMLSDDYIDRLRSLSE